MNWGPIVEPCTSYISGGYFLSMGRGCNVVEEQGLFCDTFDILAAAMDELLVEQTRGFGLPD
jgi:hypothetical protein